MIGVRAALVIGVALLLLVSTACSDDATVGGAKRAYRPLVNDPLWLAEPPGYAGGKGMGVKCQLNDMNGKDVLYPQRELSTTSDGDWRQPIAFYRKLASDTGWTVLRTEEQDSSIHLVLEKHGEDRTWQVTVTAFDDEFPATSVRVAGAIEGVEICD